MKKPEPGMVISMDKGVTSQTIILVRGPYLYTNRMIPYKESLNEARYKSTEIQWFFPHEDKFNPNIMYMEQEDDKRKNASDTGTRDLGDPANGLADRIK